MSAESDTSPSPADGPVVDLTQPTRIHLIGVGGAGMSSIATILHEMGHRVSGSDARESAALTRLAERGVRTFVGHRPEQIGDARLVLRSSAVTVDNPEAAEALARGVPLLDRRAFLPLLAARTPFVSISGTHGKTTTSSMTAVALTACGAQPSFLIGSQVHSLGASAGHRGGPLMVLEADESDGSFLAGPRAAALVTNVEADHLEFWGSFPALVEGFREFLAGTAGPRVVCVDDPTLAVLRDEVGAIGYGRSEDADYRIVALEMVPGGSVVELLTPAGPARLQLAVPGVYNALNATGALALVHSLGHELDGVAAGIESYRGVARRFERRGSADGIDFVDDYAHHPTELRAVIGAARSGGWQRIVATFQPHRYSRSESLWESFAGAFDGVDLLVVTDIYPAGEEPRPGVSGAAMADAIAASSAVGRVEHIATLPAAAEFLARELRSGDLALSLGAGDITTLATLTLAELERRSGGETS